MKLKRLPEDFQVEELTDVRPVERGDFALYRLTKRGIGTPEAVEAIARRWGLARKSISFGGLKDRHALTTQYVTIFRGPGRDLRQASLQLAYLGRAAKAFMPAKITGNRFRVTLRSLGDAELSAAEAALAEAGRDGLPNYFDDQRFGSLGESGEFVARPWIAGDFESALRLAIAEPNEHDRPVDREEKRVLRSHWGQWDACKAKLDRSHRRSIVTYLCDHPADFRGAFARIRQDLRSLYLSAFQSYLWNRILADFIRKTCGRRIEVGLKTGAYPFFGAIDEATRRVLHERSIPLPSSRVHAKDDLVEKSLGELGLTLRDIRIKHPKDSFFSKGSRGAVFVLRNLSRETAEDELYENRKKLILAFDLPRGAYATILVKRITAAAHLEMNDLPQL